MRKYVAVGAALLAAVALTHLPATAEPVTPAGHYRVEAADTWQSISTAHGVDTDALQLANNLAASTSNTAHPRTGWIIHLPPPAPPTSTTTSTSTTTTTLAPTTTSTQPSSTSTTSSPATSTTQPASSTTGPPAGGSTTSVPSSSTTQPPASGTFSADFSTAADLDRFDWQISHGGVDPFPRSDQPRQWNGDHDMACAAPPTLRTVELRGATGPGPASLVAGDPGDNVWWCAPGNDPAKGHVMTSTALTAYGHIDFAPRRTFRDVTRVCWSMNRSDLGGRKWWQVSIIPEAGFQANAGRLDYVKPNLETDVAAAGPVLPLGAFQLETFRSAVLFAVGDGLRSGADLNEMSLDAFGTGPGDRATRYRHCLVDSATGVTLTIWRTPTDPWTISLGSRFRFPRGEVRVIFQDVTYDSLKGDFHMGGDPDSTTSWHADDILVEGS